MSGLFDSVLQSSIGPYVHSTDMSSEYGFNFGYEHVVTKFDHNECLMLVYDYDTCSSS